jgi:hypothetical protein
MSDQNLSHNADDVRYAVIQPKGYFVAATGDPTPWFDNEGRAIVLLCHVDGSVTWQLQNKNGETLEPLLIAGADS